MSTIAILAITFVSILIIARLFFKSTSGSKNLPKGSLGYPLIGETFSFLQAQKKDQGPQWINQRVVKYGSTFKTSLMGSPTIVIVGQAGNKFILGSDEDVLAAKQPKTLSTISGKYNIFELTGSRYKLVKGAMLSFLKPESLQNYIKQMDELVTSLFLEETKEKDTIKMVIFMKKLTFSIACKILFGIHDDQIQESLFEDFSIAFKAVWSLPLNIIGTAYWRGLQARARIQDIILTIMKAKKEEMSLGKLTHTSDIIACLLRMKSENEEEISEQVVVDNFFTLMIASHDTSAILLSIMVWKMSKDPELYNKVLEEQMGILKNIEGREEKHLNWGDIQKMKYTWRVAQEILRIIPPVFGSFRRALKDTSFSGYDIPKGWQVFWTAYGTHMSEDMFENPTIFDPSRFDNLSKPIPPYTYIPFGGGLHTCIGNEFARVETLTIIHKLVTLYKWSTVYSDEVITRQPMPYPSMGLPIKVNPIMSS